LVNKTVAVQPLSVNAAIPAKREAGLSRVGEQGGIEAVTAGFQKLENKARLQRDFTTSELSPAGRLSAKLVDVQAAARKLADPIQAPSNMELRKAASTFVVTVNKANQASRENNSEKIAKRSNEAEALAAASAMRTPAAEMPRGRGAEADAVNKTQGVGAISPNAAIVTVPPTRELERIGINTQPNGNLAIDAKKFDAAVRSDPVAVRSALSRAAQAAEKSAGEALDQTSPANRSTDAARERARTPEKVQADQVAQAETARQISSSQDNNPNTRLPPGI